MIRLACVPFPAPGGPSSTTGPTAHEVSCAIGWPKPPDLNLPDARRGPPRCSNPFTNRVILRRLPWPPEVLCTPANHSVARFESAPPRLAYRSARPLPAAPADSTAARSKPVVVAHDQLGLNLRDRIHGHAHHN